jgi:hypothetical protein
MLSGFGASGLATLNPRARERPLITISTVTPTDLQTVP